MEFIDHSGAQLALFLGTPNWANEIHLEIAQPFTEITPSLNREEFRENFGVSNRFTFDYTIDTRDAAESTRLKLWLDRLEPSDLVAVPLWTDGVELNAQFNAGATVLPKTNVNPVHSGAEWVILSPDATIFEIGVVDSITSSQVTLSTPTTLNWPAGTMMFPLLFGRLSESPKFKGDTDEVLNGTIKFQENSSYARRLNVFAGEIPLVGAGIPNLATAKLWDIQPNHAEPLSWREVEATYRQLGFLREEQIWAEDAPKPRGLELEFLQEGRDNIARLSRMFSDRRGPVRSFMIPDFSGVVRLTQDLPIGSDPNLITVEASRFTESDYATHPGHSYLALVDRNNITPLKLSSIDGFGLHTAQPIAQSYRFTETKVSPLLRARFAEPRLTLTYLTDALAIARIKFIEVPQEYALPVVDPPERAKVYRFTEFVDVAVNRGLFTSYERALDYAGATWQPAPLEHKEEEETLILDDGLAITTWDFPAIDGVMPRNPMRSIVDGTLQGRLWCDVDDVNALDPDDGTAEFIIGGWISKPDTTGKDWTAVIDPFDGILDLELPRFYKQKVCNVALFSPRCAFGRPTMKEDFKSVGTIAAITDTSVDLAITSSALDPLTRPDGFFASGGKLEGGTGETFERATITHSEVAGGNVRLHFKQPLLHAGMGAQLRFWPGCPRTMEACDGIFGNRPNFRGHNCVPIKNPSANIGRVQQSAGGKKG